MALVDCGESNKRALSLCHRLGVRRDRMVLLEVDVAGRIHELLIVDFGSCRQFRCRRFILRCLCDLLGNACRNPNYRWELLVSSVNGRSLLRGGAKIGVRFRGMLAGWACSDEGDAIPSWSHSGRRQRLVG